MGTTRFASVTCARLSVPLHTPFVTALRRTTTTDTVVVRVTDSDGATGWGEAPQVWQVTGESLAGATACLDQMLAPVVLDRDVDDWSEVLAGVQTRRGPELRRQGGARHGGARRGRPPGRPDAAGVPADRRCGSRERRRVTTHTPPPSGPT